jgi:hypothetical protein
MSYAVDHASALADVTAAGAAVTFTVTNPGTSNPLTGQFTGNSTSTVTGSALRVKGDPKRYEALNLVESEAPTLLFTPTTYGQLPSLEATVTFGGTVYRVRDVDPLAPDGTAILARIVVSR